MKISLKFAFLYTLNSAQSITA